MAAKNVGSVAMAIGQWLTDSGLNLNRPIRSLTKEEVLGIAWEAIGMYNDLRAERAQQLASRPDGLLREPAI
jgi:hypothetical protein